MKRLIAVVLVILLAGMSGVTVYEYILNQQITNENQQIKQELSLMSSQLASTQEELNRARTENAALKENITQLQQELEDKALQNGAITIGLTFLWNPADGTFNRTYAQSTLDNMNEEIWKPFHIYYFIYAMQPEYALPTRYRCDFGQEASTSQTISSIVAWAWNLYPVKDIPVIITFAPIRYESGRIALGCQYEAKLPNGQIGRTIVISYPEFMPVDPSTLSHELLHVFDISDGEIDSSHALADGKTIPSQWSDRIQKAAKVFQMPIPTN